MISRLLSMSRIFVPSLAGVLVNVIEKAIQACGVVSQPELQRHRILQAFARFAYPSYTLSDWGRYVDRQRGFREDMQRLYSSPHVIFDRRFSLAELAKVAAVIPGDIAEAGCFNGGTAYAMAQSLNRIGVKRQIHLFDSFAGLSKPESVDGGFWKKHDLACDLKTVEKNLNAFDNICYWPGWIPCRYAEVASHRFSLVHIDVDLFQPTLDSLEFFYPRVTTGGLIVLDDYGFVTCPGATEAADAFFADKPEFIMNLSSGGALIIKAEQLS